MAAKKNTLKQASKKGNAKPTAKTAPAKEKPMPAKQPAAKSVKKPESEKKKAAPIKAIPAKKSASAKKQVAQKKSIPSKETASSKKAVAEKSVKKISQSPKSVKVVEKPEKAPKVPKASKDIESVIVSEPVKVAAPVKTAASPTKKSPTTKSRSSVVDYPAPPAPIKPPFVPPKAAAAPSGEPVAAGSNGTHTLGFIQKQRQRLLDLRDDLMDAVSGMARDTIRNAPEGSEASGSGQHQGDAGSDAYDRDFALSVLAKEQDALYEIEQAIRRIQSGSYGICEMSSRKIPQTRLEAIPFARLTVECQGQWEKEYGNRRFRPSNEVGFSGGKYAEDEDSDTVSLDEDDD